MKELKFFNKGFKEKRRVDYRIVAFKKAVAILEGARLKSINSCVRKLKDKVDVESNEQLLARLKKISTKVVKANAAVMLQQLMKFDFQNVPFLVRQLEGLELAPCQFLDQWKNSSWVQSKLKQLDKLALTVKHKKDIRKGKKKLRRQRVLLRDQNKVQKPEDKPEQKSDQREREDSHQQAKEQKKQPQIKSKKIAKNKDDEKLRKKIEYLREKHERTQFRKTGRNKVLSKHKQTVQDNFECHDYEVHPSWAAKMQEMQKQRSLKFAGTIEQLD